MYVYLPLMSQSVLIRARAHLYMRVKKTGEREMVARKKKRETRRTYVSGVRMMKRQASLVGLRGKTKRARGKKNFHFQMEKVHTHARVTYRTSER